MKIVRKMSLFALGCCAVLGLASCGKEQESNVKSYVTVEINPSVEIVLDEDNAVITINGLNDDGKMLITDEEIIGKDIEKVLDIIIEEAQACGYLVSTEVANAVQNNIKVSVSSSDEKHLTRLENEVEETVESIIDKEKINAEYEKLEAKKREHLAYIAKQYDPSLTDEKIAEMTDEQLFSYVELATIEKAELATIEMEKYYLSMKNYEFQIQYKEQIAKKLESLSSLTSTIYKTAINALKTSIDNINKLQHDIFVSKDSKYLELLGKINEYKDKNIVLNYKLSKGQTKEGETEITVVIDTNKEAISKIETEIITIMNEFNKSLEVYKGLIQEAINTLEVYEKNISNVNYSEIMTSVENTINSSKDGLLAKFEEEYASDIEAAKTALKERKQSLETSIVR